MVFSFYIYKSVTQFVKIVGKLLSSRLKTILSRIINPNQTAFITGRQILNGFMITNDMILSTIIKEMEEVDSFWKLTFTKLSIQIYRRIWKRWWIIWVSATSGGVLSIHVSQFLNLLFLSLDLLIKSSVSKKGLGNKILFLLFFFISRLRDCQLCSNRL